MKSNDFDIFIKKIFNEYYNELKSIDNEKYGGKVLKIRKVRLKLIFYYYESFRKDIRKMYMSEQFKPMDRHKIAANIMCSILKAKIIKVNRNIANLPLELLLANEYVAAYCAFNIVELYKDDLLKNKKIQQTFKYSLCFPQTYIDEEGEMSYIENLCKALFYSKNIGITDIFAYANVLFLIEKYTDTVIEMN